MNVWKSTLRVARKDLKILFKDRGQLAVLFLLPLVFALMLGGPHAGAKNLVTASGEAKLSISAYVVNQDEGSHGAQVEDVLRTIQVLRVLNARSVDLADRKVADGEAPAAIIIPADFSSEIDANRPTRIRLIKDPAREAEAQVVAGILNEVLTELAVRAEVEYGIRAVYARTGILEGADAETSRAVHAQTMGVYWTAVQEIRSNPAIVVQREELAGEARVLTARAVVFGLIMPVFSTMFAFFLVGFMAKSILDEREAGSFRRLLAAPIPAGVVVAGKLVAFIGVVFMQMVLLLGICSALFDMPLGDAKGLLALTLALALAATGLGMLVGSLARSGKQAESIGMILGFVLWIASGYTSFRIDLSSGGVEVGLPIEGFKHTLSQLTPHAHAIRGYTDLIVYGADLKQLLPNIAVLLGFAAVFLTVAIWRFRLSMDK
jgi:ABC-2 type transport system permease protein